MRVCFWNYFVGDGVENVVITYKIAQIEFIMKNYGTSIQIPIGCKAG